MQIYIKEKGHVGDDHVNPAVSMKKKKNLKTILLDYLCGLAFTGH